MRHIYHLDRGFLAPGMHTSLQHQSLHYRPVLNKYNDVDSVLCAFSAWKCIWKMFTSNKSDNISKDFVDNLLNLIDKGGDYTEVVTQFEKYEVKVPNFDKKRSELLEELICRWKVNDGSACLSKLKIIKDVILKGFNLGNKITSFIVNRALTAARTRNEADMLLLLNDVLFNDGNSVKIPPIASIYKIYAETGTEPTEALMALKCELYKHEINRFLDVKLARLAKINPPVPPPLSGSSEPVSERKKALLSILGTDMPHLLELADDQIEEASQTMLKCIWLLDFYNKEIQSYTLPPGGIDLLLLPKSTCDELYKEVLNQRLDCVKDQIMFPLDTQRGKTEHPPFIPKVLMLKQCRYDQIKVLCKNIADWERIEKDRVTRLKCQYGIDISNGQNPCLPCHRAVIGGGKPLPQKFYVNPDDDPNYIPDDTTESGRMLHKMLNEDREEEFTHTDTETKKKHLALVAQDLEPYEHLTPRELSDMFLKNAKKEYEFAETVYKRKMQREASKPCENDIADPEYNIKNKLQPTIQESKITPPEGYIIGREQLLTDAIVFLSNLEHLQWQYASCIHLPMESLVYVKRSGSSFTNPKPSMLCFNGGKYQVALDFLEEYVLHNDSKAQRFRKALNDPLRQKDIPKASKENADDMLLFGEDPLFLRADHEIVQELVNDGAGLKIHSKIPGHCPPPITNESQKEGIFYRMKKSQPSMQVKCSRCNYTIFSHDIISHHGEQLQCPEFGEYISDESFKCPMCNETKDKFLKLWTTGTRGYTPEPYPVVKEEDFDEN